MVTKELSNGDPELVVTYEGEGEKQKAVYEKSFWEGEKIRHEGAIKNGTRDGKWLSYYRNGEIWSEKTYKDGLENGPSITYFDNGQIRFKGQYELGEEVGEWKFYNEKGDLLKTVNY